MKKEPKYRIEYGDDKNAIRVALAACFLFVSKEDLYYIIDDLENLWGTTGSLPEAALEIGAYEMYSNLATGGHREDEAAVEAAKIFIKEAAFLFLVDAIKDYLEQDQSEPVTLERILEFLRDFITDHLRSVNHPDGNSNCIEDVDSGAEPASKANTDQPSYIV